MSAVNDIIREIAELPDRTSPEDQPDMMLVTEAELRAILADYTIYPSVAGLRLPAMDPAFRSRRRKP